MIMTWSIVTSRRCARITRLSMEGIALPRIHLKIACGVLKPHIFCTSATFNPLDFSSALIFAAVAAMLIVGAAVAAEVTDDL